MSARAQRAAAASVSTAKWGALICGCQTAEGVEFEKGALAEKWAPHNLVADYRGASAYMRNTAALRVGRAAPRAGPRPRRTESGKTMLFQAQRPARSCEAQILCPGQSSKLAQAALLREARSHSPQLQRGAMLVVHRAAE